MDPLSYVRVEEDRPLGRYLLVPPPLSQKGAKLLETLRRVLSGSASLSQVDLGFLGDKREDFVTLVRESLRKIPPKRLYSPEELLSIAQDIHGDLKLVGIDEPYVSLKSVYDGLGMGDLEFLLYDPSLEEIMVNGYEEPVFVYHVSYGMMETNIHPRDNLQRIVRRIASFTGTRPPITFINAQLPGGSRINVVGEQFTGSGAAITIRKFRRERLSLVDIINRGTISPELAAYLWMAVEGMSVAPRNIIISGNTGGGKTTTLNALLDLVPLSERIITIEDTREISLLHPNWVHLSRENDGADLEDLLINALRMRPDRLILGEVRGKEAETLLAAMNVGHTGMGTLHANSGRDTIRRLTSPPMGVPRPMLQSLDLIVVQHRVNIPGVGTLRRVVEVVEVSRVEGDVGLSTVFRWNRKADRIERTDIPLTLIDALSNDLHVSKREIMEEMDRRRRFIEVVTRKNLDRKHLLTLVNAYYSNPDVASTVI